MSDHSRSRLADFLVAQPETGDLTRAAVLTARTRQDLGLSSLTTVLLLVRYIEEHTDGSVTLQPEWISLLGEVDGMASVLDQIDAAGRRPTPAIPR